MTCWVYRLVRTTIGVPRSRLLPLRITCPVVMLLVDMLVRVGLALYWMYVNWQLPEGQVLSTIRRLLNTTGWAVPAV